MINIERIYRMEQITYIKEETTDFFWYVLLSI